jgi:mRNA interferase RelE/StbE
MAYKIVFTSSAEKAYKKLPADLQDRIFEKIQELAENPRPNGYTQMNSFDLPGLKIKPLYRIRIGNYRVVYGVQDKELIVTVVKISHRNNVYK